MRARVGLDRACPGRAVEAEALWYDPHRWAAWIDGFGHVVELDGDWPRRGARLVWDVAAAAAAAACWSG